MNKIYINEKDVKIFKHYLDWYLGKESGDFFFNKELHDIITKIIDDYEEEEEYKKSGIHPSQR